MMRVERAINGRFNYRIFNVKTSGRKVKNLLYENLCFNMEEKLKIEIRFLKLEKNIKKKEIDDITSTIKSMLTSLLEISEKKGRKRIIVVFEDLETALKISSFEKGKFLKNYLETAMLVSIRDEFVFRDDDEITMYIIKPKIKTKEFFEEEVSFKEESLIVKINTKILKHTYKINIGESF